MVSKQARVSALISWDVSAALQQAAERTDLEGPKASGWVSLHG